MYSRTARTLIAVATIGALPCLVAARPPASPFMAVDEVKPGMSGIGRTVFAGDTIDDFQVTIIGVLRNVVGPKRDLILAKLSGGPLAEAGVIAGMSGSPVYIDGRLVGAVSYQLGSFPKEPIAGITPIAEMTSDADTPSPHTRGAGGGAWPTAPADVFASIQRIAERAAMPLALTSDALPADARAALATFAPTLRPIGAAMVMHGFAPELASQLSSALGASDSGRPAPARTTATPEAPLRPGDAVGISLVHGDFETGATGTVTYVNGTHVYAFGHPFLNLGPTSMAMTRAHVYTVLPSLYSSMKIADMGPVVGTLTQDRTSAVGGTLGAPPKELRVSLSLATDGMPDRRFTFYVLHDASLTPLFTYVAVLNALAANVRQTGALTVGVTASASFGADGTIAIDDIFTGDAALTGPSGAIANPIAAMIGNEWHASMPDTLDVTLSASEDQNGATIERAWLDTTKPQPGATHTLHVMLRHFRGDTEVLSMPVTMPARASGALSLLVCDGPTLTALEKTVLHPGTPHSVTELVADLNRARRNNRVYVRLLVASSGTTAGGETLPSLPVSARDLLGADKSTTSAPVARSVLGAWEQRLDIVVRGSRELPLTLVSGK